MARDSRTIDLFSWQPPEVVRVAPEDKVRSASLRGGIAKIVSLVLKECGMSRDEVARRMSAMLGEEVPKAMLDAYASEAREEHSISFLRVVALCEVTRDPRLLQFSAARIGHSVIPNRYLAAVDDAMLADKIDDLTQRQKMARRHWKGPR